MDRSTRSARLPGWGRAFAAGLGLVLGLATAAAAQYGVPGTTVPTTTPTPTTTPAPGTGITQLVGIGDVAQISATGFRMDFGGPYEQAAVWTVSKQSIAGGFQSTFQFQISNIGGIIGDSPFGAQQGGDGFAFVIQNFSIPVVGPPAGFLGYHGLPNSLAVQFDTWMNLEPGFLDPNGNYISVHTRGTAPNSVSNAFSLGQATNIPFMKDGGVHTATISYVPGTLQVFMDNPTTPVLTIPNLDLSRVLSLDNGNAWIGFTSGTGAAWESHDILSWQFGPAGVAVTPVPVTPQGPLPVMATPVTPMPSTPMEPFILPPATPSTTSTGATTSPPY